MATGCAKWIYNGRSWIGPVCFARYQIVAGLFFADEYECDVVNESSKIQAENEAIDRNEEDYAKYPKLNTEANDRTSNLKIVF